ncbi:MAG: FecR family protein [Candidatus Omnitrophota bacterium]
MKKLNFFVLFLSAWITVGGAVSFLQAAEIIYLEGSVQVQSAMDDAWKKAEKGMQVDIGDSIRTARHSRVDIALDAEKKNTIRLEQRTQVVLNSASEGTLDRLDLSRGMVYSNLENIKAGLSFEVNTPSAVAGVRGSSYRVYTERDSDEVSAYKDTVFIKTYDANKQQTTETMLPEGFKTFIERFETPGALIQVSLREFERFDNLKDDLLDNAAGIVREKSEGQQKGEGKQTKTDLEQKTDQSADQGGIIEEVSDTKDLIEDSNVEKQIEERETPVEEESHGW